MGGGGLGGLYLTPGLSHSGDQENTGEEVTLVRHPVMEVKQSESRRKRRSEQTGLLQSKWLDEGGKGQEVLSSKPSSGIINPLCGPLTPAVCRHAAWWPLALCVCW